MSAPTQLKSHRLDVVLGCTEVHGDAALDLAQTAALRAVLARFEECRVPVLLMKGAALSHLLYAMQVRPRNDDDLLVDIEDFDRAASLLIAAGYMRAIQVTAAAVTGQQLFSKAVYGITHHVDLHARPLNPFAFASLPPFATLWAASVAVPSLGSGARAIGSVHALLLACAHRVAHHTPTEDPLWLFDVHCLAARLTAPEWQAFVEVTTRARCARICASELRRAQAAHATSVPAAVLDRLECVTGEPTAYHLRPLGPLRVQWLNLRDARTWRQRIALIKAHLWPPADYMRERFDVAPGHSLTWPYTRRLLSGGARWMREFAERWRS